jgi:hypothetical protein
LYTILDYNKYKNFFDVLHDRLFCENFLSKISFDDIFISFDFSNFEPSNELDILLSLNGKLCTLLLNQNQNQNQNQNNLNLFSKDYPNFQVVDSRYIKEKIFKCFVIIYNIDIKNREFIIFSKQLKEEKKLFDLINNNTNMQKVKNKEVIVYRNSHLDKNLNENFEGCKNVLTFNSNNNNKENFKIEKNFIFENIFIENKFDTSKLSELNEFNIDKDKDKDEKSIGNYNKNRNNFDYDNNFSYLTRNKFTLI